MGTHGPTELDLEHALDVARRAAAAGGAAALRHHRTLLDVERKADRSPVTIADRESEAAIVAVIKEGFPSHQILAEEGGAWGGPCPWRWIIDPLDGTRGYSRGGSSWGPLVALEDEGEIVMGVLALPALGETYWAARGLGSFRDGTRLRVSGCTEWSQATLVLGELSAVLAPPRTEAVLSLVREAGSTRCPGDLEGATWVLRGIADAWLEAGVKIWDLAATKILLEEAGGRFTDFEGTPSLVGGTAIATNGLLHDYVLCALARSTA